MTGAPEAADAIDASGIGRAAELAKAKESTAALLAALEIDAMVVVDDFYYPGEGEEGPAELAEAMAGSSALHESVVEMLLLGAGEHGFADVDEANPVAVRDFLQASWDGLPGELQRALISSLRIKQQDDEDQLSEEQIRDDLSAQVTLKELFSDLVEFHPMSMTEWVSSWRTFIDPSKKYLVLIDRTLTREEHGAPDSGETLLAELLSDGPDGVYAGLFTHTASDEAAESALMGELRDRMNDHRHRVVVLGKFRARDVEFFPAGLRVLLLVQELAAYRELTAATLDAAAKSAADEFAGLNDYLLTEAMAAANDEGLLELEHPLRIAQRTYSQSIVEQIRTAPFDDAMLASLRRGTIQAYQHAARDEAQILEMLQRDRFEPEGLVNTLGLPIELGDIFLVESLLPAPKRGGPLPRYYVLLGQACDLTVRSKGEREPHIPSVFLHEFTSRGEAPKDSRTQHDIGVFDLTKPAPWRVKFRHGLTVPIDAIDATVFTVDGRSVIDLSASEGRRMAVGWLERQKALIAAATKQMATYVQAEGELSTAANRADWLTHLAASLTGTSASPKTGVTVHFDTAKKTVTYGIRRVGRIRGETAARIADLASAFQSRPAFEADLAGL